MVFKALLSIILFFFPWPLRRWALTRLFGYQIHATARIGFSMILVDKLEMGPRSRIANLTVCKGLALLQMGEWSSIGNLNQITGFPANDRSYFGADRDRRPELILGRHSAVTERHIIDCTDSVRIGDFATFAGYRSQILTHSLDLDELRQTAKPVAIGDYCFVGTGSILLSGTALPDYSVLGAGSLLNATYTETHFLYAGIPARPIKPLSVDTAYFCREMGAVH
jgi:acetyltransferase-like isoleucine patch superfamily enzyme